MICREKKPHNSTYIFTELCPFEIFHMKIVSPLYLLYRREYFHESLYKYKPPSDYLQKQKL